MRMIIEVKTAWLLLYQILKSRVDEANTLNRLSSVKGWSNKNKAAVVRSKAPTPLLGSGDPNPKFWRELPLLGSVSNLIKAYDNNNPTVRHIVGQAYGYAVITKKVYFSISVYSFTYFCYRSLSGEVFISDGVELANRNLPLLLCMAYMHNQSIACMGAPLRVGVTPRKRKRGPEGDDEEEKDLDDDDDDDGKRGDKSKKKTDGRAKGRNGAKIARDTGRNEGRTKENGVRVEQGKENYLYEESYINAFTGPALQQVNSSLAPV